MGVLASWVCCVQSESEHDGLASSEMARARTHIAGAVGLRRSLNVEQVKHVGGLRDARPHLARIEACQRQITCPEEVWNDDNKSRPKSDEAASLTHHTIDTIFSCSRYDDTSLLRHSEVCWQSQEHSSGVLRVLHRLAEAIIQRRGPLYSRIATPHIVDLGRTKK
ncbi:hypothetical protein EDB85DRAFT_1958349 [Lactarius pseudohatsudake]|nr:hypothetical protein EDB85DRAFT_1958349 [Lactarius pseudohatsudake]